MVNQDELGDMKEDAERGHGIDNEKTLDLILDINRLNRLMPHTGETCKCHKKESTCTYRFQEDRACYAGTKCDVFYVDKKTLERTSTAWELKE